MPQTSPERMRAVHQPSPCPTPTTSPVAPSRSAENCSWTGRTARHGRRELSSSGYRRSGRGIWRGMATAMLKPTTRGSSLERFVGALVMTTFSACYFYALLWLPAVRRVSRARWCWGTAETPEWRLCFCFLVLASPRAKPQALEGACCQSSGPWSPRMIPPPRSSVHPPFCGASLPCLIASRVRLSRPSTGRENRFSFDPAV